MAASHESLLKTHQPAGRATDRRWYWPSSIAGLVVLWLIVVLVAGLFSYYNLRQHVSERVLLYQRGGQVALTETEKRLEQLTGLVASDPKVRDLVAQARAAVALEGGGAGGPESARVRAALTSHLQPVWDVIEKDGGRQLHIHLPDKATSFLRLHERKRFGDALASIRPLVEQVLSTGKPARGFEVGRIYSGYRVIDPVFAPGDPPTAPPVGSVEIGSGLNGVLSRLEKTYGIRAGIVLPGKLVRSHVWKRQRAGQGIVRLKSCDCYLDGAADPVLKAVLDQLGSPRSLRRQHHVYLVHGQRWVLGVVPLQANAITSDGSQAGKPSQSLVVGVQSVEDLYDAYYRDLLEIILIGIVGLALSIGMFFWGLRRDRRLLERQLHSSERGRQSLFELSPSPITETDAQGAIIQSNTAYARTSGLTLEQILGRRAVMLDHDTLNPDELQEFWATLARDEVWRGTFYNRFNGGRGFWDSVEVVPITDGAGNLERMLWFHHDISDEYGALERARQKYHALDDTLAASPAVIYRVDVQHVDQIEYISPNVEAVFGYPPRILYDGAGWWADHVHPDDLARVLAEGDWHHWENDQKLSRYRLRHADGHYGWVSDRARLLRNEHGEPATLVGALSDADQQIQLQRRLAESERLYRLIFENVKEAVFLVRVEADGSFRYLGNNSEHARATGLNPADFAGKRPHEILPAEIADWMVGNYRECVRRGTMIRYAEHLDLPGGPRYWNTTLTPVPDENGAVELIVGLAVDQTEDQRIREELQRYADQLERAQVIAQLGYFDCNLVQGEYSQSELLDDWFGICEQEENAVAFDLPQGFPRRMRHLMRAVSKTDQARLLEALRSMCTVANPGRQIEVNMRRHDGLERVFVWDVSVRCGDGGQPITLAGTLQDITDRVAAEQSMRTINRRNSAILRTVGEGIFGIDQAGRFNFVNPAACQLLGAKEHALEGQQAAEVLYEALTPRHGFLNALDDAEPRRGLQDSFRRLDGTHFPVRLSVTPLLDEFEHSQNGAVVVFSDITEIKQTEARLRELATTDALTGMPNRRHFMSRLEEEFQRCRRYAVDASVLMIDIDLFKQVNDRHGHAAGDEVLMHFARMCRMVLRKTDICGRLGGEEFALLLPNTHAEGAREIAERLRAAIEELEVGFEGRTIRFTASIGGCLLCDETHHTASEALVRADEALYQAKQGGRNRVRWCAAPSAAK